MRRFLRQLRLIGRRSRAVRVARAAAARLRLARWPWLGTAGASPWLRRGMLVAALLGVALVPYPVLVDQASAPGCHRGCRGPAEQNMLRWTAALPGDWSVTAGLSGTTPASGQAYVAVGYGIAAVGYGLTVAAFSEDSGRPAWPQPQSLPFPPGAQIVSVRTWQHELTVGVVAGGKRTEVVLDARTGAITGQYPSALFGGAIGGTASYTVIVGPSAITSYDNKNGKVRWRVPAGADQAWRSDGTYLYLAESTGGALSGAPVTGFRRITIATGFGQRIIPVQGVTFAGALAAAYAGIVLFTSPDGTTAYDGVTGVRLWFVPGAVPEGADPLLHRIYLSRGSSLVTVHPLSGRTDMTVTGVGGGLYVLRDGVALGLDLGADGAAWGYDIGAQRVSLAASGLGWPHYFADLSGLGGSADPAGTTVLIASCAQTGGLASPPPSSDLSSPASASASSSPSPGSSPQPCLQPKLVALSL